MTSRRRLSLLATVFALLLASAVAPGAQQAPALQPATLAGLHFRTIGPAAMSGRIVDIAVVESNTYTYYAASATGGVWKTTDNGTTFTPVFQNEPVASVGCVTVSQSNPNIVWVGSGEATNRQSSGWGDGVYKSTDAGKTWTNMGLHDSEHIGRIVLHPTNPDIVYVAALGHLWGPNKERGLYKSIDGGRTWTASLQIDEDTGVSDVAMDPSDPNILYAAAHQRRRRAYGFDGGGPGNALYKTTDAGAHWTKLTNGLPSGELGRIGISIYRKNPNVVYVSVEQGLRYNASTAYEERKAGIYRSDDKGATWTLMSDWNPRPTYASQIRVDPNDDQRIYMVNYSYSNDGGKTFVQPRQSLHGDDRMVWIDPHDSRHLLKADDGGVGVSYDRGVKWIYVRRRCRSASGTTSRSTCGRPTGSTAACRTTAAGAGRARPTTRPASTAATGSAPAAATASRAWPIRTTTRTFYSESQYLGLLRNDSVTDEARDIRPDQKHGFIQARRNWKTWGKPGAKEPELGNAMAPANWDGPFILSPFDSKTIYAGTNQLWKSTDRGDTWTSLGDMTTGVDRSTLRLMGQLPTETSLSLDDGAPYYPTITEIAESPLKRGLLYVGTDDGNVQVSQDDGRHWANLTKRFRGLPESMWVSGIEASRHDAGTVYVSFDGHRSNEFGNYLYRSTDFGETWTSIAGDLPADRVIHAVHEDPKNPNLVYVGTERGLYLSADRGGHWIAFRSNLPRVPVNDFVIHPRDNDLVLATHGRGVWILDDIASLQQLTPAGDERAGAPVPSARGRGNSLLQSAGARRRHGVPRREPAERRDRRLLPAVGGRRRVAGDPRRLRPGDRDGAGVEERRREPRDLESAIRGAARASARGGIGPAPGGAARTARHAGRIHRAADGGRADTRAEGAGERGPAHRGDGDRQEGVDRRAPLGGGHVSRRRGGPRADRSARRGGRPEGCRARAPVARRHAVRSDERFDGAPDGGPASADGVLQERAGWSEEESAVMHERTNAECMSEPAFGRMAAFPRSCTRRSPGRCH